MPVAVSTCLPQMTITWSTRLIRALAFSFQSLEASLIDQSATLNGESLFFAWPRRSTLRSSSWSSSKLMNTGTLDSDMAINLLAQSV